MIRYSALTPKEFQRRYRMTLETFNTILAQIKPKLCLSSSIGNLRVHNGAISPELKLSAILRWLAGKFSVDVNALFDF
jgi:hypothetical protein